MRTFLPALLPLLMLALHGPARAQTTATDAVEAPRVSPTALPHIEMNISPAEPAVDDVVTVSVVVTGKIVVDDGITPAFTNLTLLYAQQLIREEVRVGDRAVPRRTWYYYLLPEREGRAGVEAMTARGQGGTTTQLEARTLKIGPRQPEAPIDARAARALMADDGSLAVRVAPDAARVQVGQPLVITAKVFSGGKDAVLDTILRSFSVGGVAVLKGPSADETPPEDGAADSITLIPQEAGTLQIGTMTVLVKIAEEDHVRLEVVRSRPFAVSVVAPPPGAPDGFDPANIGRFTLSTRLTNALGEEASTTETGQNVTLEVRVTGDSPVGPVRLMVPESHPYFIITPSTVTSDLETSDPHVRLFRYTLTPVLPGSYDSPEVAMAYYDPEARWYRTLSVPGRSLEVTGEPLISEAVSLPVRAALGGLTLGDTRRQAFRAEVGWPGLRLTSVQPVTSDLDVAPQLSVVWGDGLSVGLIGLEAGLELRYTLWQHGPHALGLLSESAFIARIPLDGGSGTFGGRLGLGLIWGLQLRHDLAINAGVRLHPTLTSGGPLEFRLPVLLGGSVEYLVSQTADATVNLAITLNAGPDFCLAGGCGDLDAVLDMGLGISVSW